MNGYIDVMRICQECNSEYRACHIEAGEYPQEGFCKNSLQCPNCEERDDPWILVKTNLFDKVEGRRIQNIKSVLAKWRERAESERQDWYNDSASIDDICEEIEKVIQED